MPEYTTSIPLDNPYRGSSDPAELFEREGREFFRDLARGVGDLDAGVNKLFSAYAEVRIDQFNDSGRYRTRRAYELLRGDAERPDEHAGPISRLFMMCNGRLWFCTLSMWQLGLPELAFDRSAQFDRRKLAKIKRRIKKLVCGPWFAVIEVGRVNGKVHIHLLHGRGACRVGHRSRVRKLLKTVRYICKKPHRTRENAMGYLEVVRADGNVGRRLLMSGLTQKVTVAEAEKLLGFSILKPSPMIVVSSVQNLVMKRLERLQAAELGVYLSPVRARARLKALQRPSKAFGGLSPPLRVALDLGDDGAKRKPYGASFDTYPCPKAEFRPLFVPRRSKPLVCLVTHAIEHGNCVKALDLSSKWSSC